MKKLQLMTLFLSVCSITIAQNNFVPTPGGSVYLGTPTAGPNQGVNLQVHGVYKLCNKIKDEKEEFRLGLKVANLCPLTSRILMTNEFTGLNATDGMLFQMSNNSFSLKNQEKGNIEIRTGGLYMKFDANKKRIWVGHDFNLNPNYHARYNVTPNDDNGIFIRTKKANKYGLSIQTRKLTDNAIQVMSTNGQQKNFTVQANGHVFARKYTTTLANIPDYVFNTDYNLMPLSDLRTYINTNKHLPNIPSATEYEETGVDLGELNRLLLEKTEELTLYILQLEKRLNKLESK